MKSTGKSKEALLMELRDLQHDYELLKIKRKNDISEHLKVVRELRISEERWRKLVTTSPDFIALHDIKGNYVFLNHYTKGFTEKDTIGRPAINFITDESKELFKITFKKCLKTNGIQKLEYKAFGENRKPCVYEGYLVPIIEKRKVVSIMSVAKDITDRRQTEEGLRLEKENFRHSLDESPLGVRIATINGDTIYANWALLDYYGYDTLEEFQKTALRDRYTHESYALAQKRKHQRERGDLSVTEYEISIVRKDGRIRHLQVFRKEVLWDGIRQFQIIYKDITLRKQAEMELHLQSEMMKNLTEGIFLIRSDNEAFVYTNPKFDEMFGYEHGELIGKHVSIVNAPTDKSPEEIKKDIIEIINRTGEWHGEIQNIKKNGERFWCYANVSVFDHPHYGKVHVSVHSDINSRKQTEEKIRNASLYTRNLIEVSLDPLVTINAEGMITDVNFATEIVTGIKREKLIGSDFVDFFTDPENARKGYMMVFSKGMVKDYPLTILHTSGRTTDVLYNATLFKNEAGEVKGVLAAARDITDRKKMEEELRRSKELLEELYHHLSDIREDERAIISREIHDQLGQSMTALKLDLNRMYKYLDNNPEAAAKLKGMIELVSDTIKNVQRISSDLRPGILDELGLVSAIEWYCDEFEKRSGIKCNLKLDNSDFSNSQINLVLFRVLQEAFTNVIRHAKASSVSIKLLRTEKGAAMTIQDNGIGITKEQIESFKSLGLISMHERVRQFNGTIDISSKKDNGTKLVIFIPL